MTLDDAAITRFREALAGEALRPTDDGFAPARAPTACRRHCRSG
jgi:hypothetical protein